MRISDWSSDVCSSDLPSMSVEQHLLALTRIGPDVRRARCAETSVRNLYPHRLAGDLYILVAPVALISLARMVGQRDEGRSTFARILPAGQSQACHIAALRIITTVETVGPSGGDRVC